jgi:hypothetical protein
MKIIKRICFCSLAFILLTAGAFGASSAATFGQDNSAQFRRKPSGQLQNTASKRQVARSKGSRHVHRTIIFVGGKKGSQGAATKSSPARAIKSNGTLNPQPIPPGKQRKTG